VRAVACSGLCLRRGLPLRHLSTRSCYALSTWTSSSLRRSAAGCWTGGPAYCCCLLRVRRGQHIAAFVVRQRRARQSPGAKARPDTRVLDETSWIIGRRGDQRAPEAEGGGGGDKVGGKRERESRAHRNCRMLGAIGRRDCRRTRATHRQCPGGMAFDQPLAARRASGPATDLCPPRPRQPSPIMCRRGLGI